MIDDLAEDFWNATVRLYHPRSVVDTADTDRQKRQKRRALIKALGKRQFKKLYRKAQV